MRVFQIQREGMFVEYMQTPFENEHEESVLEDWLELNPECILEGGGILLIGRQEPTDLGGSIDLLGLDRQGNVVVVELKRDRTPRDAIAQALEYASFAAGLDTKRLESILRTYRLRTNQKDDSLTLAKCHRSHFKLDRDEAVSFNKDQRVVIIGQRITPGIKQTAAFLNKKGVRVTCAEFALFEESHQKRLVTLQRVVDDEHLRPSPSSAGPKEEISREDFLATCDDNGKHVFSRILAFADNSPLQVHWHAKAFSLKLPIDEIHVPVIYGYSPEAWLRQTLYTFLFGEGGTAEKAALPEDITQSLHNQAQDYAFFEPAGMNLKCQVNREFSNEEIDSIEAWCMSVEEAIRKHGLKS